MRFTAQVESGDPRAFAAASAAYFADREPVGPYRVTSPRAHAAFTLQRSRTTGGQFRAIPTHPSSSQMRWSSCNKHGWTLATPRSDLLLVLDHQNDRKLETPARFQTIQSESGNGRSGISAIAHIAAKASIATLGVKL
jgi:hypothetical protein